MCTTEDAKEHNVMKKSSSLDVLSQWSPPPGSVSSFLSSSLPRRWCLCQTGARRPQKAGGGGGGHVTTNKNSAVTPRNLIRNHWFTLWIETEYLESGSSSQATDRHTRAFNNSDAPPHPPSSFCSHLWTRLYQFEDDMIQQPSLSFYSTIIIIFF